ncbi:MAG: hypothetical protein SVS15_11320, partial [Thermodesulfobacteriota bacterium]|nr:hypothetical protein [Thermodesulfobacteriota bacterium]
MSDKHQAPEKRQARDRLLAKLNALRRRQEDLTIRLGDIGEDFARRKEAEKALRRSRIRLE